MEFDFSSLTVPGKSPKEVDPRAIFRSLPVGANGINDLWDGQARALSQWHELRTKPDNVILLNTGAGKSIVGLLIAESLRRELNGNVIYMCANNDLVQQISKEASRIGLDHTVRAEGQWSNASFQQSKAVCITNYQAVLQPYSVFKGELQPHALVLDDAHVAEGVIRDQFTLRITADAHAELFSRLKALLVDQEPEQYWRPKLSQAIAGSGVFSAMMCSPLAGVRHEESLNALFTPYLRGADRGIAYPLGHLYGKWRYCSFLVSRGVIEITPPILPTLALRQFADPAVRRVYLSATLDQGVDFARAFGREMADPIRPDVDAGNGERLILFSGLMGGPEKEGQIVSEVVNRAKLLVAVPSGLRAERWKGLATPPPPSQFSATLDNFRRKDRGAFVLVGRYDGIDLPNDTCRIMALDGVPRGSSLLERFMWEYLDLQGDLRSRIATRITQLFGRIIRGRVDFGVFFIFSPELNNWLSNDRNAALLPELLRKQLRLGTHVHSQLTIDTPIKGAELAVRVLGRQEGWSRFYSEFINSSDVDAGTVAKSLDQQETLAKSAAALTRLWSALWSNDDPERISRGREGVENLLSAVAVADSRAAGWINIWLGAVYSINGEGDFASDRFRQARSRLFSELPLPRALPAGGLKEEEVSSLARHFISLFSGGITAANNRVVAEDKALAPISDVAASHSQFEEAVKTLGTCLGFRSSRPDNEEDIGPDNLWSDGTVCVGLEAKTNKTNAFYNKDEIGQAHQHWEWMSAEAKAGAPIGVYLIGNATGVTEGASPNATMSIVARDAMADLVASYKDLRSAMRAELGASRLSQMATLGIDDEWSLQAICQRLRPSRMA